MSAAYPRVVRECSLDWIKFDAALARDGSIDPTAKALYAAIASFADKEARSTAEDPDDFDVPTRPVLAACIGKSVKTVDRATVALEEAGLLEVERRRDPDNPNLNLPSVYRLLDTHRWDERAAARVEKRKAQVRSAKRNVRNAPERGSDTGDATPGKTDGGWGHGCPQGGDTGDARGGDMGVAHSFSQKRDQKNQKNSPRPPAGGQSADADESENAAAGPSIEEITGAGAAVAHGWLTEEQLTLITEGPRDLDAPLVGCESEQSVWEHRSDEMYRMWCTAVFGGQLSGDVPPPARKRRERR